MGITYTTVDDVKDRIAQISGSNVTDEMISGAIFQAEGIVDSAMRLTGRGTGPDYTFDEAKHGLIKDTTTALGTYMILNFLVEDFQSTSSAALTADLLWAEVNRNFGILLDDRVRKYVQEV